MCIHFISFIHIDMPQVVEILLQLRQRLAILFNQCHGIGLSNGLVLTWWHPITLTHWGWVTHICVGNLTIIVSDNGLSPGRRQAIIWTNAGILLIQTLGTNFSENLGKINSFSFSKMHLKMSSGKCRPFCLGLNVLSNDDPYMHDLSLR